MSGLTTDVMSRGFGGQSHSMAPRTVHGTVTYFKRVIIGFR